VGHGDQVHADVAGFDGEVDRIASIVPSSVSWHVAGYSLGGRIALGLVVRHPERFESATLIGAQPGLESDDARTERRAADERWCHMLRDRPLSDFVTAWAEQPLFLSQASLPADVLAAQRAVRLAQDPAGLERSLRLTGLGAMPSYRGALGALSVPTTLVAGSDDHKFAAIARSMASEIPRATLHIVAGAGHNVVLERPESVRALLLRALAGGGAS
jgi:2-succinyl-6-hydroxy-2,4-cyclohexadiene-1-carboxylate synthase